MSRTLLFAFLGLVVVAAPASACSLAYQPFEKPTWEGDLRYVDGDTLRMRDGDKDRAIATGFFISYAVADDTLVVSGQRGLGADCSGDGWLRVIEDGEVTHAGSGLHKVFDHHEGAIVVKDEAARLLPWDGSADEDLQTLPRDTWAQAWSPHLHPAYETRGTYHAGGRTFELPPGATTKAAPDDAGTAVLVLAEAEATVYLVPDDPGSPVEGRTWPAGSSWSAGLAWADAWYVVAAGELFRLADEVERIDVGAEVVGVAARGDQAVAFHETGYVILDGTTVVGGAERDGNTWTDTFPSASARKASSAEWRLAEGWSDPPDAGTGPGAQGGTNDDGTDADPVETVPGVPPLLLVVALALLVRRRL